LFIHGLYCLHLLRSRFTKNTNLESLRFSFLTSTDEDSDTFPIIDNRIHDKNSALKLRPI